ncbi:hypothetical protein ACHAQK_004767 [Fusarium lateritium]
MLTSLPPEVLEHICEKLNGINLKQLSLTAKWLQKAAFRQLWRSITIEPAPVSERHVINHHGPPQPFIQSIRELHFDAGTEQDTRRCIHVNDWLGSMRKWVDKEPQEDETWQRNGNSFGLGNGKLVRVKYECLAQRAMVILMKFDKNQLEHFSPRVSQPQSSFDPRPELHDRSFLQQVQSLEQDVRSGSVCILQPSEIELESPDGLPLRQYRQADSGQFSTSGGTGDRPSELVKGMG